MKGRLKGATKGHSLLKKKSDALTLRFRAIVTKLKDVKLINFELKLNSVLTIDQKRETQICYANCFFFFSSCKKCNFSCKYNVIYLYFNPHCKFLTFEK